MATSKRAPSLQPGRFRIADIKRNAFAVDIETGHRPDDLMVPEYWSAIAVHLRVFDTIEVRAEDHSFWGVFLVTACDRVRATVTPISLLEFKPQAAQEKHRQAATA